MPVIVYVSSESPVAPAQGTEPLLIMGSSPGVWAARDWAARATLAIS